MKIYLIVSAMVVTLGFSAVSCLPKDELIYKGPTQVEIKNYSLGIASAVLTVRGIATTAGSQTDSTRTVLVNKRVTDSVLVQLVGPQSSKEIVVNFDVRATSTAVEGVHFNFNPVGARSVIIPPNSSSAYILLDMIPGSITTGTVRTEIDLIGNDRIKPNPNYDVFKVTIRP